MLRTMREKFKHLSWTLWLVIITFIVGFSMSDFFSKKDPAAADFLVVGDEKIDRGQFEQQLFMTLENYNAQFQNKLTQQTINQLRIPEQVLQNMVSSAIIHQEAMKMNLTVTDEELSQQITAHPSFQQNGQFIGRDNYERMLEMRRIKVVDFEQNYRKDILLDKLKQIVTAGVTIDEPTLRELFTQQNDQVDLDYVALTPDSITEAFTHTDAEISALYDAGKEQYMSPERRTGRFLFLPFQALKSEVKLTDDALFQYYRDNKEQFKIPAKRRISRIFLPYGETDRSRILKEAQNLSDTLKAENFAEQAKALSKDAKAANGGDWGETEWQSLSKQEISIAEKLLPKQISTPVDSGSGFALLYAAEATPDQYQEFNVIKPRITSILERQKLGALAMELIGKTVKGLKEKENILTQSSDPRIEKIEGQSLANGDPVAGTDELGYLSRALFSMKIDDLQSPIELPNGLAVAQLTSVEAPAIQPLEKVKERVAADLTQKKKAEKLMIQARSIAAELNAAADEKQQTEILTRYKLKVETTEYHRGNRFAYYPIKAGLDDTIFSLPLAKYDSPIDLGQAVVLPKAKSINISTDIDYQAKRKDLFTEQLSRRKDDYFTAFILNRRDRYPIQFNEPVFTEIRKNILGRYK